MYRRAFRPSKSQAREFAMKMQEIEDFCHENHIASSLSNDSYYFEIDGQKYRVSNHSVESSRKNSGGKHHEEGRMDDTIYIHAGKTRIIEIYTDLKNGRQLDGRGNPVRV